mmetsp:Transcript_24315/g.49247  ORF Transcript_24315/g.49247 Transcript_24315/m.49247 type:complete len:89 (+) Transcript_24315:470-736(+)
MCCGIAAVKIPAIEMVWNTAIKETSFLPTMTMDIAQSDNFAILLKHFHHFLYLINCGVIPRVWSVPTPIEVYSSHTCPIVAIDNPIRV